MVKRAFSAIVISVLTCIAFACLLCGCTQNSIEVTSESDGSVTFTAQDGASGISEATIDVGKEGNYVEIHADLESGDMMFVLTGENSEEYGGVTFESTRARSELIEVDEGRVTITLNAHNAKGTAKVRTVTVLDGPGTAGS